MCSNLVLRFGAWGAVVGRETGKMLLNGAYPDEFQEKTELAQVLFQSVLDHLRIGRNQMKLITAIIKPFKLDDVREAVAALGVEGLTVSEVKGFGRQKGHTELYRGAEYQVDFLPKVKLEIATSDDNVEPVIEAICKAAYTGKIGDGKIFVYDLEHAVRIRTGETDGEAL
jgi:nitrogen regulatory protein P-II 2